MTVPRPILEKHCRFECIEEGALALFLFIQRDPRDKPLEALRWRIRRFFCLDGVAAAAIAFGDGVHVIDAKGTAPRALD